MSSALLFQSGSFGLLMQRSQSLIVLNVNLTISTMSSAVNPYKRRKTVVVPVPKTPKPRCGKAQAEFIEKTRGRAKDDPTMLRGIDWRLIACSSSHLSLTGAKKISVDSFYVKDIAMWMPHVVMTNCVPACNRCEEKTGVDVSRWSWVDNPKMLHGLHTHRYLDSVEYFCITCGKDFQAWNEDTLRMDGEEVAGVLNFRTSSNLAVDDELCSFVVAHSTDTTTLTHQRVKDLQSDHWVNMALACHRAVLANRVKPVLKTGPIDCILSDRPETERQKKRKALRWEHAKLVRAVASKQSSFDADISFTAIARRKENRNSIGEIFPGIGKGKCQTLIRHGILSAKSLLEHEGDFPAIKCSWKATVQKHHDDLQTELAHLKGKCEAALTELNLDTSIFGDVSTNNTGNPSPAPATAAEDEEEEKPRFSDLCDPTGFNCRVVSPATVNRIDMTDFVRRRSLQLAKMRSIKCKCWKIDWHYKLASKIKVCQGRGKCFSPCKSALTVQNEDAMTVFWKFCEGTESIETAKKDLILLKKRNTLLCANDPDHSGEIFCTWVDNCCQVGPKTKEIAGAETHVKLDSFHWQERWDETLPDKKSEKTAIFRKLMRRALFCTEDAETAHVEALLIAKHNKKPSPREIFKEAKATIPPPEQLERRVVAALHALMEKDLQADRTRITTASNSNEGRFFKPGPNTLNTTINQLSHVKKGCLFDPPDTMFSIFRVNPKTQKAFAARSAGTDEVDNRHLNRLLDAPSVGLTRADRLTWNCCERSNDSKMVKRLGLDASETSRTEQMAMLHSLASKCGFEDFPKKKPLHPTSVDTLEERIGFDCHLPEAFCIGAAVDEEEDDMAEFLDDVDFEQRIELGLSTVANTDENDDEEEDLEPIDAFGIDSLVDVSIYMPQIFENERTHDTFVRKTQERPWTPFAHPKDAHCFTPLDKAEHASFDDMVPACSRKAKGLDGPRGFKTFAKAWDLHVANRIRDCHNGEEAQKINRKSYLQLQQHFDNLVKQKELLAEAASNDKEMKEIERMFKATRKELQPHQSATNRLTNISYEHNLGQPQFGVPIALNTPILANAFQRNQCTAGPPIVCKTQQPTPRLATKGSLGKLFKSNKCCWRCGFRKNTHARSGASFGDKCMRNCGYEQCSKCNQRVIDCHAIGFVGPHCPNEAAPSTQETVADWWKDENQTGVI